MQDSPADDDLLELLDEPEHTDAEHRPQDRPWRVLIVDDDGDVHKATELAMQGLTVEGQPLVFLHASSAAQARQLLADAGYGAEDPTANDLASIGDGGTFNAAGNIGATSIAGTLGGGAITITNTVGNSTIGAVTISGIE